MTFAPETISISASSWCGVERQPASLGPPGEGVEDGVGFGRGGQDVGQCHGLTIVPPLPAGRVDHPNPDGPELLRGRGQHPKPGVRHVQQSRDDEWTQAGQAGIGHDGGHRPPIAAENHGVEVRDRGQQDPKCDVGRRRERNRA